MIERQEERLHPHLEGRPWRGDASLVPFLRAEALGYAACYQRDARNEHSLRVMALLRDFKNPIHFMLYEGAFFHFEDNGTLYTLKGMPCILGDVNTIAAIFMTQDDAFTNRPIIIIRRHPHLPSQNHKRLILRGMLMYRNFRARLHSI